MRPGVRSSGVLGSGPLGSCESAAEEGENPRLLRAEGRPGARGSTSGPRWVSPTCFRGTAPRPAAFLRLTSPRGLRPRVCRRERAAPQAEDGPRPAGSGFRSVRGDSAFPAPRRGRPHWRLGTSGFTSGLPSGRRLRPVGNSFSAKHGLLLFSRDVSFSCGCGCLPGLGCGCV